MASDKEKDMLEDEEIIDLTEVFEDGLNIDPTEEQKQAQSDSGRHTDQEVDLNDLFYSVGRDKTASHSKRDDFEELFHNEAGNAKSDNVNDQQNDVFLKDFFGDDQEDEQDQSKNRYLHDKNAITEDKTEPDGLEKFDDEDWEEKLPEPEHLFTDEGPEAGLDKPVGAIATLAEQLESLSDRMDMFEEKLDNMENSLLERTINALEEEGPELGFLNKMFQDLKKDISAELAEDLDSSEQDKYTLSEEEFKERVFRAIEEKGLEFSFVRDLRERITQQTRELIDERCIATPQDPEFQEDSDLKQKIQEMEHKIREIEAVDPEELKQEMKTEFEKVLEEKMPDFSQTPDSEVLKQEMNDILEERITSLIKSWQSEKKMLASELEDAVRFWGKMQENISALRQNISELRNNRAGIDSELMKKFESANRQSLTREDLEIVISQLKLELENHILKKVPEAAARVIREEIAAIVSEKRK